jgi:spore coat-associated protein N
MAARLTLVFVLVALAVWAGGGSAAPAGAPAITLADGAFTQSNSRDGQAILSASNMAPGSFAEGSVTLVNTGSTPAAFTLARGAVDETPSPAGGRLSAKLRLLVEDTTAGRIVHEGPLTDMSPRGLGQFAPSESHTYNFRVTFPSSADDNAYAGGSLSVRFDWISVSEDAATPPPPPTPTAMQPRLALGGAAAQRVLRQGGAVITAGCDQACTLSADGSMAVKGSARAWRMLPARASAAAGHSATLKVRLSRGATKALKSALERRRKVRVSVTVTGTAASGQNSMARRSVRVLR